MINNLIAMKLEHKDFNIIAKYILALPKIGQSIIILISKLYQKVQNLKDFQILYQIFKNNFHKTPQTILSRQHI